jgi:PAS domain S-box-containing protein
MNSAEIAIGESTNHSQLPSTRSSSAILERGTLLASFCVLIGYYVGAKVGFALTFQPHPVSVLWPPNSILVSALLLTSPRVWWILLLAALPAHLTAQFQSHVPPAMILCWYVSNCCEALIGATGVRLLIHDRMRFNRLRNIWAFCLCVVFVGPFLSSFLDAAFVIWNQFGKGSYWEIWRLRTSSNVLAALIVAPLIVTWASGPRAFVFTKSARRYPEAALLFLALLLISLMVLYRGDLGQDWLVPYLPLPFLMWAAVRFGSLGASTGIATIGFLTIWSAAHGHGPFSAISAEQSALSIQIFLIVLSVPILFLGTLIEELASGETELRESEKRFRTMADAAPVLIWVSGPDKLCTFFNKAWLEFTGRKMEQELGNGWAEGVHVDDFDNCLKTYVTAFDDRKPFTIKYRLRRHDGEYRFVSDTGVPRYGVRGAFRGYVGACTDITDLLAQQKVVHEFEERVALAAEAAHLGVWELNTETNELWVSDKARELFQFGSEPISLAEFCGRAHPEDRAIPDAALKEAIETGGGYEIEYRALLPDGAVRWISGRARCLRDEKGALTRLLGVSMDVTERKQAQELFQLATEASSSGILLITSEGQIVLANAQVEKLFNYWREELIGKPVEILVPERFSEHFIRRKRFVATPEARLMEPRQLFGRRKDGTEFPAEIGLNPIRTPQGILVLATVTDISARKIAEEQMRKSRDEIDRLSRISLLGEMTASIAHELNQPLSGIISNASAGQRFIDRGEVDVLNLREILEDIVADGRRANDVIRHIRNTIKKGAAIRESIKMNDLVTSVAHMVHPDTVAHSCELEVFLDQNLPVVKGDPIQIQQVLINLVTNAYDAMRNTPASRRKVKIATEWSGNGPIRVSVRDYGPGIPDEIREHLFEQFFTTKKEGLGMGLAIVRSIIESHGGKINVENVDGDGACFYFTLPITMETNK